MSTVSAAATPLSVMQSWLGTKEVPGPKANPVIVGKPSSWFSLVEHPDERRTPTVQPHFLNAG